MQLMVFLGGQDKKIQYLLNKSQGNKYSYHDIQNGHLEVVVHHVLPEKLEEIRENVIFSIMGDKYTDISNKEQLLFGLRSVNEYLEVKRYFLGFYQLTNLKCETVFIFGLTVY